MSQGPVAKILDAADKLIQVAQQLEEAGTRIHAESDVVRILEAREGWQKEGPGDSRAALMARELRFAYQRQQEKIRVLTARTEQLERIIQNTGAQNALRNPDLPT